MLLPPKKSTQFFFNLSPNQVIKTTKHYGGKNIRGMFTKYRTITVTILTYGHELWLLNKRVRSQVRASKMSYLRRIEDITLCNKVRSRLHSKISKHRTTTSRN